MVGVLPAHATVLPAHATVLPLGVACLFNDANYTKTQRSLSKIAWWCDKAEAGSHNEM